MRCDACVFIIFLFNACDRSLGETVREIQEERGKLVQLVDGARTTIEDLQYDLSIASMEGTLVDRSSSRLAEPSIAM